MLTEEATYDDIIEAKKVYIQLSFVMPQSHTHLRTLRMVRKARPQLSAHSVTIRITSAENVTVRILSATYRKALSIRAQILKNIKKVLRMKTTH